MVDVTSQLKKSDQQLNGMAPIKNGPMEAIYDRGVNKFGSRPPDIIPMVSYMNDHKKVDYDSIEPLVLDELPYGSSTLIRNCKKLEKKCSVDKEESQPYAEIFEQDSLENITEDIKRLTTSSETMKQEKNSIATPVGQSPRLHHDETSCSRKLPPTPIPAPDTPTTPTTPTHISTTDDKSGKEKSLKGKVRTFWRANSLPLSPFSTRKSHRSKKGRPPLERKSNSLHERLRQSIRRKEPPENVMLEQVDLFPLEREKRYHQIAKRRGRRGAVICLEVNQSRSLVKSSSEEGKFLEFNFVPTMRHHMSDG